MKHKIAILSDIHGNATALEAVIADAKTQGTSEYWLMGDIFLPAGSTSSAQPLLLLLVLQLRQSHPHWLP